MEASTSNGSDDVKTFRGRSLEELLPQIRAELGPDAIVLRRREGLGGGVGGFFQRPYVEVDARAPHADERPLEIRSDRATVEGLSSPAVQALFEQATPFADALAAAARDTRMEDDSFSATVQPPQYHAASRSPTSSSRRRPASTARSRTSPRSGKRHPRPPRSPSLIAPTPPPVADTPTVTRPIAAEAAEDRLIDAGLSPALAADVVGEAVVHALPFSAPRNLKKLIRAALARRIPVTTALGPGAAHDRHHRRRRRRQDDRRRPSRLRVRGRRRRRRRDRAARRR